MTIPELRKPPQIQEAAGSLAAAHDHLREEAATAAQGARSAREERLDALTHALASSGAQNGPQPAP